MESIYRNENRQRNKTDSTEYDRQHNKIDSTEYDRQY